MIGHILAHVMPAAFSLLPPNMDSREARVMLLAIGMQESRFKHRKQIGGPAHGFWQFEGGSSAAVGGVLRHPATSKYAGKVCDALRYRPEREAIYEAITDNDTLACAFARLLLWTLPNALPTNADEGWAQYLAAWRPGRPHPETWPAFYEQAGQMVP